jgi:hypothetical protein
MALVGTSIRLAYQNASRPLQFSVLLLFVALFVAVGGYFLAGQAVVQYDFSWPATIAGALVLLSFAYVVAWFADEIAKQVGHETYMNREAFFIRGANIFLLWLGVDVVSWLLYAFAPHWLAAIVSFVLSLYAVYASVAIAVDGASLRASFAYAHETLLKQGAHVLEFLLLAFFLLIPIFVLDAYSGFLGMVLSVLLVTYLLLPWLLSHAILTYLQKYPMVVSYLKRFERS